jgi:hypothetical protein
MELCNIDEPKPKKGKKGKKVDACPNFKTKSTSSNRKIKFDLGKSDPTPTPEIKRQGAHMNVRDLDSEPGVVKPSYEMTATGQKRSSYQGAEGDQTAQMAEMKMTRRKKKK